MTNQYQQLDPTPELLETISVQFLKLPIKALPNISREAGAIKGVALFKFLGVSSI